MGKPDSSSSLELMAPLSGILVPLESVPDPVFARKLVGDGVSIDPTSQTLVAPCAGTIIQVHACGHAATLETAQGIEIMMHIGLDTVRLKGKGFTTHVKAGDRVTAGQPLIDFDGDFIATHARSLLTQILITTPDRVAALRPATGVIEAGKTKILSLDLVLAPDAQTPKNTPPGSLDGTLLKGVPGEAVSPLTSEAVLIPNPSGLHARPAAVLVQFARRFNSEIWLQRGESHANAKSVVSLMALDVRNGDKVQLVAIGTDARQALDLIVPQLRNGLGEEGAHAPTDAVQTTPITLGGTVPVQPPPSAKLADPKILVGVSASPGLAVGRTFRMCHSEIEVAETGGHPDQEQKHLNEVLETAGGQLANLHDRLTSGGDAGKAAIFAAHQELLTDPDVLDLAHSLIAKGKSAPFAWRAAFMAQAERLAGLSNELLAGRANDLRDVGTRVLRLLTKTVETPRQFSPETILIAEDLTPSDTATLDRTRVLGFCTVAGGSTSHVAILARSLGIPAIAGIEPRVLEVPDGTLVILDGSRGSMRLDPDASEVESIRQRQKGMETRRQADFQAASRPAVTRDGQQIAVVSNIGSLADAVETVKLGGEGVGLLRSEFLFLDRSTAPGEDEQFESYRAMAQALGTERPLTIRTLDVGGDKPLSYLPIPKEENPFLGERGIRIGLDRPDILRTQLRAILRAAQRANVQVMFPMISSFSEWRQAKGLLDEEANNLGVKAIPAGIMVEVPSAALLAEVFATEVAFFSLGTNDLTQYTLAMDRGHPKLAPRIDGLHPAVLHLVARTCEAGKRHGKKVSVCGGLAGDNQAIPILIGLGVSKLSVSVPALPGVKARVRKLSFEDCCTLARKALTLATPAEVRALVPETGE